MLYLAIAYYLHTEEGQTDKQTDRAVQSEKEREREYVIQMTRRNNNNKNQRTSCLWRFFLTVFQEGKQKRSESKVWIVVLTCY